MVNCLLTLAVKSKSTDVLTMNLSIIAAFAYGILAIAGGIIGYIQARSKVSLLSGSISGFLLILAAYFQLQGQTWGSILAVLVTAVLVVVFAVRLAKTRKFMPAGLMTILGMVALAVMVNQIVALR
ncbi:protein of unknown function UPF0136 [Nostoc punctiforme PCC 73102]|jgi:uncharacterized membrane protein (UPF0136 family)|uniref:Small integral membrane protein n=2 Tax=Nostoc punctiforme TaxID=272131 RepID=B2J200_NOSP7|nr:protein of unknown function UPF0136 [Nostoc punctiforme PCC 73102]